MIPRKKTRAVKIGSKIIGGDNAIAIQSMCNTKTEDIDATLKQISDLAAAGCEIIRVAVPHKKALEALPAIKKACPIPLVADIHFDHTLAIGAIEAGVDKVRINPGNIGGEQNTIKVIHKAKKHGTAIRLGVNSGSLEQDLAQKHTAHPAEALVESALRNLKIFEDQNFHNVVISIKASHALETIEANRLLSTKTDSPLHLGVTEAGRGESAIIKSAIGIGALLAEGIGDTIRVSLTDNPLEEIKAAKQILSSLGIIKQPEIIACPTCGRTNIDLQTLVKKVETEILPHLKLPLVIAVMGCCVNGPGEAKKADVGIAGEKGTGIVFREGKVVKRVKEEELLEALKKEIKIIEKSQSSKCLPLGV